MKNITKFLVIGFFFFFLQSVYAAANSPVGFWKTIDDVSGQPKAIVQISSSGATLYGRILKIFPRPGHDQNEVCKACKGSRHNQRIVGMVIMEGLTQDKNSPYEWTGGRILDPENGKTYKCNIKLVGGSRLNVRGYIGVSMFGRTQTWIRVGGA